jgi:hypothetical protein
MDSARCERSISPMATTKSSALVGIGETGLMSAERRTPALGGHRSPPPREGAIGGSGAAVARLKAHPLPVSVVTVGALRTRLDAVHPGDMRRSIKVALMRSRCGAHCVSWDGGSHTQPQRRAGQWAEPQRRAERNANASRVMPRRPSQARSEPRRGSNARPGGQALATRVTSMAGGGLSPASGPASLPHLWY